MVLACRLPNPLQKICRAAQINGYKALALVYAQRQYCFVGWITYTCLLISALLVEKQAHRSKNEAINFINLSCHRHASFSVFQLKIQNLRSIQVITKQK